MIDTTAIEIDNERYERHAAEAKAIGKLAEFRRMVHQEGQPPQFAIMLLTRTFPGTITDKQFMAGVGTLERQFEKDPVGLKELLASAKRQGANPSMHDVYVPSLVPLGAAPGHPDAFVPSGEARSQILRRAEKRKIPLRGRINRQGEESPPPAPVKMGRSIVRDLVGKLKATEPDLAAKKTDRELAEIVIDRHGPRD